MIVTYRTPACDLFLFAHPDDDIFVRPLLREQVRQQRRVVVVYLTHGGACGRFSVSRRRNEAMRAMRSAGIADQDVHFVGIDRGIADGELFGHMEDCFQQVCVTASRVERIESVVSHAWEGGHPDHDAAHLVARAVASLHGCLDQSRAFPAYRSADIAGLPFAVYAPHKSNGPRCDFRLGMREGMETLLAMRHYRSQWKTFLGLGPGIALQLLFIRRIPLQRLGDSNAPMRPSPGRLLSETRFGAAFDQCEKKAISFMKTHGIAAPSSVHKVVEQGHERFSHDRDQGDECASRRQHPGGTCACGDAIT